MPEEMHDAGPRRYFWTPRMPLAVYAAYVAMLVSLGQHYSLFPWVLIGAVALGIPAVFIIIRAVRTLPRSRLWFSSGTIEETQGGRPGLGVLLIVVLTGPAPFLLSAVVEQWLSGAGVGTMGLLVASAAAGFGLIFGGYCLIEAVLNNRAAAAGALHSSVR
ncbi:hypothetical protein [Arthrobacter pigmenti]